MHLTFKITISPIFSLFVIIMSVLFCLIVPGNYILTSGYFFIVGADVNPFTRFDKRIDMMGVVHKYTCIE